MGAMKSHHYWKQVDAFKQELREAVPHDVLKALHRRSGPRHLAYAAREFRAARQYLDAFIQRTESMPPTMAIALEPEISMSKATLAKMDA